MSSTATATTRPRPRHDRGARRRTTAFKAGGDVDPAYPDISDDEIRETIEKNQLRLLRERGADLTIFSPRASAMAHHVGDEAVSQAWTRRCNDLIKRVVDLFPETFVGVCQLPQSPGVSIAHSIAELERCVAELGFVGCNLNPDPSGGHWTRPAADRPGLVPLLREDGRAGRAGDDPRLRLLQPQLPRHRRALHQRRHDGVHAVPGGRLFSDFPTLRFIIPHGGGAVPYHWGRYRGAGRHAEAAAAAREHVMGTSSSTPASTPDRDRLLFRSDRHRVHPVRVVMVGAVRRIDPETEAPFRRHVALRGRAGHRGGGRSACVRGHASAGLSRLDAILKGQGR
jgi:4-oxalmesaconate hydratase